MKTGLACLGVVGTPARRSGPPGSRRPFLRALRFSGCLALCLGSLLGHALAAPAPAAASAAPTRGASPFEAGDVLIFRHATAPGGGDPSGFQLGQCATQRNLDPSGREEARRLGERLYRQGLQLSAVWVSPWCRTRDTAALAFPGQALVEQDAFASFFNASERQAAQTQAALRLLDGWRQQSGSQGQLVVVTHQVNITALTGVFPASAEGVQLRRSAEGWKVVRRWPPP